MARARAADRSPPSLHRTLSTPGMYLWRMFVFLVLVGLLVRFCTSQLREAMLNNPGLNFLIFFVLFAGILYSFQQVLRLYPEIRWVNAFRIADPGLAISHRPVLLSPMATMLRDRTGSLSLSATSMRSIMDSIGVRLDEARDTGPLPGRPAGVPRSARHVLGPARYHPLGRQDDRCPRHQGRQRPRVRRIEDGLAAPLRGMGTAFSSSLLGLGGSLVLGFLELQASHAHGRFYNQLEEWLSGITELAPRRRRQAGDYRQPASCTRPSMTCTAPCSDLGERLAAVPRRRRRAAGRGGRQGSRQGRGPAGAADAGRAEGSARMGRRAGRAAVGGRLRAQGSRRHRHRAEG